MRNETRKGQFGGGVFIAIGPFVGLMIGSAMEQPSAGLVGGIAVGAAIAIGMWLWSR